MLRTSPLNRRSTASYSCPQRWHHAFTLAATVLLAPLTSQAAFITNGCAAVNQYCTLQELSSASAFINIDGVVFNNFFLFAATNGNLIKVSPIDTPGSGAGSGVGLRFEPFSLDQNPWFLSIPPARSPASFSISFEYDVNVLSGLALGRGELDVGFIENVSGGFYNGFAGSEDIQTPADSASLLARCEDAGLPFAACDGATVAKSANFLNSESLHVVDGLFGSIERVTGSGKVQIGMSSVSNVFGRVPEPGSGLLSAAALMGLAYARRRQVERH
jgi:hypothetical protein